MLQRLARRDPSGYTFALPTGTGRTLLGASPELLVSRHGNQVVANPLAGSAPRSADPAEDVRRAAALPGVGQGPARARRRRGRRAPRRSPPYCARPDRAGASRPWSRTATMWHLSTTVTGDARRPGLGAGARLRPAPDPRGVRHADRRRPRRDRRDRAVRPRLLHRHGRLGRRATATANGSSPSAAPRPRSGCGCSPGAGIVAASVPAAETRRDRRQVPHRSCTRGLEPSPVTDSRCAHLARRIRRRATARAGYWRGETLGRTAARRGAAEPPATASPWSTRRRRRAADLRRARRAAPTASPPGCSASGIASGDRVVVQLPNIAEFFEVLFALFRLGALPGLRAAGAPRRPRSRYFCAFTEAVAYVIAADARRLRLPHLAAAVRGRVPTLRHVFVAGETRARSRAGRRAAPSPPTSPPAPARRRPRLPAALRRQHRLPKLIPRTHDDYLYCVRGQRRDLRPRPRTASTCARCPRRTTSRCRSPGSLGALYAGGRVVLAPAPGPETALPAHRRASGSPSPRSCRRWRCSGSTRRRRTDARPVQPATCSRSAGQAQRGGGPRGCGPRSAARCSRSSAWPRAW